MSDFFMCPNCYTEIKKGAKACPVCGSDEQTGWSDLTYLDGINIPDDDLYEEFKEKEFGEKRTWNREWIVITASVILLLTVFIVLIRIL